MKKQMTEQQLKDELDKLKEYYENTKRSINIKYAKSNRRYKEGDYIEDSTGIILVESIKYGFAFAAPTMQCVYLGPRVKKTNLQPYKNNEYRTMYQGNVIKQHHEK